MEKEMRKRKKEKNCKKKRGKRDEKVTKGQKFKTRAWEIVWR